MEFDEFEYADNENDEKSNCCNAPVIEDSDVCGECKEHCEDWKPSRCLYCGLSLDLHDGSGFCPGGTEEFGGRR